MENLLFILLNVSKNFLSYKYISILKQSQPEVKKKNRDKRVSYFYLN